MIITLFLILGGLLVGLAIGSNDAGNCMGTSVGAGVIDYRKALYIVAIMALVGAALQGSHTMGAVGKGIVSQAYISDLGVISILFGAGLLVIIFSIFGMPASTTLAVIGALAGVGMMLNAEIAWRNITIILGFGLLTPLIAAVISFIVYKAYLSANIDQRFIWMEKALSFLVIISGAFLAYSMGANNIGGSMGLIASRGAVAPLLGGLIGGLAISLGAVFLGRNVMHTIGSDIMQLSVVTSFTSQLGAAITLYMLTLLSIPTSSTFAIIGAIAGTGLVKGVSAIDRIIIRRIAISWVATPLLGALFAMALFKLLSLLFT